MTRTDSPVVLVAEDEPNLADLYSTWLSDEYEVRTAYSGSDALDGLDDDVDVALLDRRMPDVPGDEVLETIREADLSCRVAMVTAVEPDIDIVDMGFDEYLVKPIDERDIRDTIDQLLELATYDDQLQELYELTSKRTVLREEKRRDELENSERFEELNRRIEKLRESTSERVARIDDEQALAAMIRGPATRRGGAVASQELF